MTIADHRVNIITLKPTETATAIDWEAINPELVKAIRRTKQSGPVMTPDEFKAWLDRNEARNRGASVHRVLGEQSNGRQHEAMHQRVSVRSPHPVVPLVATTQGSRSSQAAQFLSNIHEDQGF